MNAPVFRRFAKNITISLTVLASVGLAGCSAAPARTAAPVPSPSVTAAPAVTPTPTVTPTTAPTAAPSTAPTTPAAPAVVQAKAVSEPVTAKGKGVAAAFVGLTEDSRVQVGGGQVAFQVVWTNNTGHRVAKVMPVVSARAYEGAACDLVMPMVKGTLERKDAGGWVKSELTQGTGMDYAQRGLAGAFSLAPGESRTVEFRMQLAPSNGTGRLELEAQAIDGSTFGTRVDYLGGPVATVQSVQVVDAHRPTATLVGKPSFEPGREEFTLEIGNPTGARIAKAAPTVFVVEKKDSVGGLRPEYVFVEVQDGTGWHRLPSLPTCGGVEADTTALFKELPAGAKKRYTFRIGTGRARVLDYTVGAVGDQHPSAPVKF